MHVTKLHVTCHVHLPYCCHVRTPTFSVAMGRKQGRKKKAVFPNAGLVDEGVSGTACRGDAGACTKRFKLMAESGEVVRPLCRSRRRGSSARPGALCLGSMACVALRAAAASSSKKAAQ